VIGKVYKQWSGFVREMTTDADNFGISCEFYIIIIKSNQIFQVEKEKQTDRNGQEHRNTLRITKGT